MNKSLAQMSLRGLPATKASGNDKPSPALDFRQLDTTSTSKKSLPQADKSPTNAPLIDAPALANGRYNRQMLLPQLRLRGQEFLLSSKVLIIGLGGLGSPAALYLAGAGIDTLGLMDSDNVEVSNLHRQIVHTEAAARLGRSKVHSAASRCKELNSEVVYVCHEQQASGSNILDVVAQYDLVLDCTDNPATRYLISDACVLLGKVLVSGAAQRGEGMLMVLNRPPVTSELEEKGPCYRCVFPRPPAPETVRGCSEIGILGPVVGTIGTLMAGEAIKIISSGRHLSSVDRSVSGTPILAGPPQKSQHTMLLHNTYAADPRNTFRTITLRGRRKDCLACGDAETLAKKGLSRITADVISQGRLDYEAFCGLLEDVKLLSEDKRISAEEFLPLHARMQKRHAGGKRKRTHVVVDVREEHEHELGSKVSGSVNIPLSKILRHGGDTFDGLESVGEGMLDSEKHIPTTEESNFPGGQDQDLANEGTATGPHGGMLDLESHVPVTRETEADFPTSNIMESNGGILDQESHLPITNQTTFSRTDFPRRPDAGSNVSTAANLPALDGGLLDEETHASSTPHTAFSSADFPPRPAAEGSQLNERDATEQEPSSVYFVCQRGNDSQIAAQKLIDSDTGEKRKWGWIGDVKGGFLAMERYSSSG